MSKKKRRWLVGREDYRVTAPLISWHIILIIMGIMFLLVTVQTFIIEGYQDNIAALVGTLTYYLIFVCLILSWVVWLVWRQTTGKPLRRIARAARKVASGDFTVQVQSTRKNGKMSEIDVLIGDFNKMTKELAGNEMLKSDFISNVSHEIKTPLSVILSYTKAMKDNNITPYLREQYADTVIDAAEKLNSMITNILKLNKLENQQIFSEVETYQLGEQLRRCALSFMDKWQDKSIKFEIDVADVAVSYDASLLELVWNNLLSNAIKFTDEGGRVSLTSQISGGAVYVSVRDSGCGMDRETCKRVFEKFYQGDTSRASEGNGLGLALVKKVVDIVGGEVTVKSSLGEGAEFTVKLNI